MPIHIILETAIDRCFLQKDVDLIEEIKKMTVTHLVSALQAQLLVSRLPSVVAPPSSMEAAVKWGIQTTSLSAHGTDCPYLDNLLPLPLQGAPALAGAGRIAGRSHATRHPINTLAGKPVNCLLAPVQSPFLGSRRTVTSAWIVDAAAFEFYKPNKIR